LACFFYSPSNAQETTANILDNSNWQGNVTPCSGSACYAGYSGGQTPSWNGTVFRWGYGGGSVHQQIALNQVFSDMGIDVLGFSYHWHVKNYNANTQFGSPQDPLDIYINLYDSSGNVVENYHYDYGYPITDWTHFAGTEIFADPYALSDLSNIKLTATGDDAGFWAGWYGPEFWPLELKIVYEVDACAANPLSDPTCEGYAEAYYNQQCSYDPLYDQGCTGYAEAYYTQQCGFDSLYDTGCPGYEEAYYQQQCGYDALYDQGCPGYAEAYYDQQCSLNALYDNGCPGYAEAYYDQQCSLDALYDTGCPGYEEAYYNQQCSLDALYDNGCPGYAEAFFGQQCEMNPQYSPICDGYIIEVQVPVIESQPQETFEEPVVVEQETVNEVFEETVVEEEIIEQPIEETKNEEPQEKQNEQAENSSEPAEQKNSRERPAIDAVSIGRGISDRLVGGLVSQSISSGESSATESQAMNEMMQADSAAFDSLLSESVSSSSSTQAQNDNNAAAGVGPVVVVIIPQQGSEQSNEPTEKQQSLAERLAEQVRKNNLEKSATYKGQIAMLESINSAVDLTQYDTAMIDRDEIYVLSQIYGDQKIIGNNADHYRMRRQNYGLMQQLIRSQY